MKILFITAVLIFTILGSLALLQATKSIADYNQSRADQIEEMFK